MGNVVKCKICCCEIPDYVLAVDQNINNEKGNAICSRCQARLGTIQAIEKFALIILFLSIGCISYGVFSAGGSTGSLPLYCTIAMLSFYVVWGIVSLNHKKMHIVSMVIFFIAYLLFNLIFSLITGIDFRAFNSAKGMPEINIGVLFSLVSAVVWHFFRRMREIGRLLIESQD